MTFEDSLVVHDFREETKRFLDECEIICCTIFQNILDPLVPHDTETLSTRQADVFSTNGEL